MQGEQDPHPGQPPTLEDRGCGMGARSSVANQEPAPPALWGTGEVPVRHPFSVPLLCRRRAGDALMRNLQPGWGRPRPRVAGRQGPLVGFLAGLLAGMALLG